MRPEMRRGEAQFGREFEEARPRIPGALPMPLWPGLGICLPSRSISYPGWQTSLFGLARVKGLWGRKDAKR